MIKLGRKKRPAATAQQSGGAGQGGGPRQAGAPVPGRPGPGPQVQKLRKEVEALRRRVEVVEQELQESRQLNKRLAEITDVVAEVLLPSDQRDDERLRAALQRYDTAL